MNTPQQFQENIRTSIETYFTCDLECLPVHLEIQANGKKKCTFGLKWSQPITKQQVLNSLTTFQATGIALKTGAKNKIIVVDIDNPVSIGLNVMKENGIILPEGTLKAQSQSGGMHYYFRFDPRLNSVPTTIEKIFGETCNIDVRGNGGLIYAQPTKVINGGHYQYLGGRIQPMPEALIQFLLNRPATNLKPNNQVSINQSTFVPLVREDKFQKVSATEIRNMVAAVTNNGTLRLPYKEWLKICSAVWFSLDYQTALPILQEFMPEEHAGEYLDKYGKKYNGTTIGALINIAREHGYNYQPKFKRKVVKHDKS